MLIDACAPLPTPRARRASWHRCGKKCAKCIKTAECNKATEPPPFYAARFKSYFNDKFKPVAKEWEPEATLGSAAPTDAFEEEKALEVEAVNIEAVVIDDDTPTSSAPGLCLCMR